jgi:chemotaxis-related protein WspB
MLFLLFQLGQDRYAIEAQSAVEVVPLLDLKRIPHSPPGVAGIINYRGRPVPAVDLCALTLGRPAREQLSTRIIVMRHQDAQGRPQLLGVIAERATDLLRQEGRVVSSELRAPGSAAGNAATETRPAEQMGGFLGPVMMDEKGFLQLVRPDHLLTEAVREALFAQVEAFSYESD